MPMMKTPSEVNSRGAIAGVATSSAILSARPIRFSRLLLGLAFAPFSQAIDSAESAFEHLSSDLVSISLLTIRTNDSLGAWELQTSLSRSEFEIDFRPATFDFLGKPAQISEETHSLNFNASKLLREALTLDLGAGYRDGFPTYRAVWLDTYFDQHFAPLEGVPGHELYQNFEASAASVSAGLKWEYLPANATASLSLSRIQDEVSPGYEIDFEGIARSQLILATTALSVTSENVLNKRLRSRIALTASETSDREIRYSGELALNASLAERFIWRNKIGASTENPQFDAYFFDTAVEYAISDAFSLSLNARRYRDTGEVENALLFTTAAPGLRNDSIGLGLRFLGEKWSGQLSLKHSDSDFEPTNANTDFFRNLYIDDDWLSLRLALAKTF